MVDTQHLYNQEVAMQAAAEFDGKKVTCVKRVEFPVVTLICPMLHFFNLKEDRAREIAQTLSEKIQTVLDKMGDKGKVSSIYWDKGIE